MTSRCDPAKISNRAENILLADALFEKFGLFSLLVFPMAHVELLVGRLPEKG
jgi:hypothetical protein